MKIAIPCHIQYSFFSHGNAQAIVSLAECLKARGHEVTLISTNGEVDWWDDVKGMKQMFPVQLLKAVESPSYDLCIDVDGHCPAETRAKVSNRVVMFWRKSPLLLDMEPTIFPLNVPKRDLRGLSAVWTYDHFEEADIQYIRLLAKVPVFRVPFVWSPLPIECHRREAGFPEWMQTVEHMKDVKNWDCHVCENNISCTSSCTIPMTAIANMKKYADFPIHTVTIHSADHIKNNEFFQKNVLEHCRVDGLNYQFVGRQRCCDWVVHARCWVLSHIRFLPIRPYILDLAWSGIPTVHNSPWLRDIDPVYADFYYPDNSLTKATEAAKKMVAAFDAKTGLFAPGALGSLKQTLLKWTAARMSSGAWDAALVQTPVAGQIVALPSTAPIVVAPSVSTPSIFADIPVKKGVVKIVFTDMWDDFNPEYNFFVLLLKEATKGFVPKIVIEGHSMASIGSAKPDLVVFGPFGQTWKGWNGIPKVHYTGENTAPIEHPEVKLNLTYQNTSGNDQGKIRLPLWMLEIDWFGADKARIVNPKPLSIDACCKTEVTKRNKFCAFVVTNPCNPVRNDAFQWLSAYKKVDSAGRLFNNIGDAIFAGRGGGGGELRKHEFLKDYKFCFAYENSSASGYTTEKILHAKAAGCIPIYWGDPEVGRDFESKGFLNAQGCKTAEELVELVKSIDENDEAYAKMAAVPALDDYRRDLVRRRLSEIGRQMMLAATGTDYSSQIPRFLGATSDADAQQMAIARGDNSGLRAVPKGDALYENAVVATFASKAFWESLQQWIDIYAKHKTAVPNLRIHVFVHPDVPEVNVEYVKDKYPFVVFERLPSLEVEGFADIWEPKHFAWKLWTYQRLVAIPEYKDAIIWYTDSGSVQVRWPVEYFEKVAAAGVCVLSDSSQFNHQWCNDASKQIMKITEAELKEPQIVGGLMAFVGGNPKAVAFFEEAWKFGQVRDCIVGEKWSGVRDGKPFGHRHDQTILSILCLRHSLARYPLEKVYCDSSLRNTYKGGQAVYVHRGKFVVHNPFTDRISEVRLINLDRRNDRYKKFLDNHEWGTHVVRDSACDGRAMELTPSLAKLLKPNDFLWKKAIAGCAMSHLKLWNELANEQPIIENFLILEDDVLFKEGWISDVWKEACTDIPADYDILYLGGVLPPNREMFGKLLEPVNDHWSRVAPNQIFGQKDPSRYFHFCNYAYIIRREAAKKLVKNIEEIGGYFTSADHMICNRLDMFKHYVLTPQVAGCYQDEDPKYKNSQFNNFNRVDGFDSDLWNNDERYTKEEIEECLKKDAPLKIQDALADAFKAKIPQRRMFYTVDPHVVKMSEVFEKGWIQSLMDETKIAWESKTLGVDHEPLKGCPLFFVQRPHLELYQKIFQRYEATETPFAVMHLSDEYLNDPIEFYSYKACKGVLRTYARKDIPEDAQSKVLTIPLGYYKHSESRIDAAWVDTPSVPFRERVWTFYGTGWKGRAASMEPLKQIQPHDYKFFENWLDAKQLGNSEYVGQLLNSIFVPCPAGMNPETFRLWEAIEHGAIPLYCRTEGDEAFIAFMQRYLPLLNIPTWNHAAMIMNHMVNDRKVLEGYRNQLLSAWTQMKAKMKELVGTWLKSLEHSS